MVHKVLLLLRLYRDEDVQACHVFGHRHVGGPRCLAADGRDQVRRKMRTDVETVQDPIRANDGRYPDMYVGRGLAGVRALPTRVSPLAPARATLAEAFPLPDPCVANFPLGW
jgi:hypothetical protein